ncbi:glycoside hydrolase family 3 N-terminal domain-containing protein [Catellatospora sp. KI3]|uniref:glycoside hydrolase family 3 N-terminal domain-containing protein n=1 Tax=Catellatospora sp. KI3 TaxID=3041620 RepID=UPI0024827023|nr:glycoside hydrolase family 3 N-terminal domain-containing protein [Catellatospora sp. KI3]MDI1465303.1 glycoside hydrolase family 3 N-terminal domain-containing protein [Catellatospora sp. KI3]
MRLLRTRIALVALVGASLLAVPTSAGAAGLPYQDPSLPVATRVSDLLSRMSLDDKLGQMTQAERASVSTSDITSYRLGSVLSGGGSAPSSNNATGWADMTDNFQRAALATPLGVPILYGSDAVHGHNNVVGATIFPHNIGLGATRNPALVQDIGRAVAEEVTGTGVDWDFAPCLCVARNDRWGRTYESFGEKPELVSSMATIVTGLQGSTLGGTASVLATAKHYVGDGGTANGTDQGNTQLSESELRAIHLPPFQAAIAKGVGSVMISYSSWNGAKLHGNQYLITTVLKGELGFTGFVVSDWNGIDQIDGATGMSATDVRSAVNAGIDMVMVPTEWKNFINLLRTEVNAGRVTTARVDDAVRRILTKKFELGMFEKPLADRNYTSSVGGAAHRALARSAVAQSLVLLKNSNNVLPIAPSGGKIFVAGRHADNIGLQSGGWTISWQGASGNTTPGTTILQGIRNTVGSGATVTYNASGSGIDSSYKVAIAVVGEQPYAEGQGDRTGDLGLDSTDLATLATLRNSGVPVVVVLVSGRPLDIASQLGNWSALVAAWLPGTEGQGVADVLFNVVAPTGKLPMTWMSSASQQPINDGDGKTPLFAYGYGLSYSTQPPVDTTPPSTPGTPSASQTGPNSATLSWAAATDNVAVTGYDVVRVQGTTETALATSTTNSVALTGLSASTSYTVAVYARDAAGNRSSRSATGTFSTTVVDGAPPTAPGSLTASNVTSSGATLSWTASTDDTGVVGYRVFQAPGASGGTFTQVGTTGAGTTAFAVTGLAAASTYRYYVRAVDAPGNVSVDSNTVTVTTLPGGGGAGCKVGWVPNNWGTGFTANITITNTGTTTISGWTLAWTFVGNQVLTGGWNTTVTQTGSSVTARDAGWNGTIAPGGNAQFGVQGTYSGSNPNPAAFTVNGSACTLG